MRFRAPRSSTSAEWVEFWLHWMPLRSSRPSTKASGLARRPPMLTTSSTVTIIWTLPLRPKGSSKRRVFTVSRTWSSSKRKRAAFRSVPLLP